MIAQGIAPSWEDRVREEDAWPGSMRDAPDRGDGANDRRLLDDVPPHWQPRA
nr:toxin [Schaalia hyovaginalis]